MDSLLDIRADHVGLVHFAAFYRGDDEYLDLLVPFILDGLALHEPVFVAVPAPHLVLLRDALGESAAEVQMGEFARNPARAFGQFAVHTAELGDQPIRMIGEPVWPGRTADEYPACVQNEALFNTAFAGRNFATLCPYDAAGLPDEVLSDARTTHPLIWQGGTVTPSADYAWPDAFARWNQPLPTDPTAVTLPIRQFADLATARTFSTDYANSIGLPAERVGDLDLIISELATNSLKYTAGSCRLALWRHDGNLVCEVSDSGRFEDPLAGRRAPEELATSGRGLFLVNAVADLVRTHTANSGTTIQAYLSLAPVADR